MTARLVAVLAACVLMLAGCGERQTPAPRVSDDEILARFHRGVSELERHQFVEAARTFEEITALRPELAAPWINLAAAQLNRNTAATHGSCAAALDRAIAIDATAPQPYFLRGVLAKHLGRYEEAETSFRQTLERAPDDPATLYYLASVIVERDPKEAAALLERAIEGESHFASAYYALRGVRQRTDPGAVADVLATFAALEAANVGSKANIVYTEMGRLGEAVRDLPVAAARPPGTTPSPAFEEPVGVPGVAAAVINLNGKSVLVTRDPVSGALGGQVGTEVFPGVSIPGPRAAIVPGDFDQDGFDDLAVADGVAVRILRFQDGAFRPATTTPFAGCFGVLWSDLDQDGDLDLVAWSADALILLTNRRDGAFERFEPKPAATPHAFAPPAPPPVRGTIHQVCATDLDGDGDADLLVAGTDGLALWRNDRLMQFRDATARAGLADAGPVGRFLVTDLDGDRRFDILAVVPQGLAIHRQSGSGAFRLTFTRSQIAVAGGFSLAAPRAGDLDCDGFDEIVAVRAGTIAIHAAADLAQGLDRAHVISAPETPSDVLLADLDGDVALDLIVTAGGLTRIHPGVRPAQNHALGIRLQGRTFANTMHANMGGIGARVEIVAGGRARVRELASWQGTGAAGPLTLHFGLGPHTHADYVRIVRPDDVLQSEGWVPAGQTKVIEEFQRKGSSCPILFAWNGEAFECVTDFLGVGGLGFFVQPGVYAPPDPTELVLIPRLEPRDGRLEIRIHEPFEEITYLDRVRLLVVDHDARVDVLPDERLAVQAPQPQGALLAIGARIDPIVATDGRGADVLDLVTRTDRAFARAYADRRFIGYAEPTTFTFDFGAALERVAGGDRLVLALDGWVEYPYSHVNYAAWQAGVRLEAPSIDLEVAGKGFVPHMVEAGYPAGLIRTMTLPLGKLPEGLTGRMRIRTNHEIWIDRLYLFEPDRAPLEVRALAATRAELRTVGYPREYSPDGRLPRLYDYAIMDPSFPWKTMGGAYTRFGCVGDLLRDEDDCYVVFGPGEEVALAFDAPPPPPPGRKRTYILDTFGWCKDMDPYTAFPYTVEPLPFRAMSNYPPAAHERFPDGEAQRAWRERYQTRVVPGTRSR